MHATSIFIIISPTQFYSMPCIIIHQRDYKSDGDNNDQECNNSTHWDMYEYSSDYDTVGMNDQAD